MAREAKKDPNELTVEEKLRALYQLQTMLSEIDKIKTLRGELPLEVQDLEDEVAGLSTRIEKIQNDIAELKSNVATKRIEIEAAKVSVEKYKSQQDNVRNNREYDVLSKEIEFQTLEIELCEKRIRKNSRNGLGVVYVQRDACGGCFNKIPPQKQLDIRSRKKIIVCEYCGRIMVDPELAGVVTEQQLGK